MTAPPLDVTALAMAADRLAREAFAAREEWHRTPDGTGIHTARGEARRRYDALVKAHRAAVAAYERACDAALGEAVASPSDDQPTLFSSEGQ